MHPWTVWDAVQITVFPTVSHQMHLLIVYPKLRPVSMRKIFHRISGAADVSVLNFLYMGKQKLGTIEPSSCISDSYLNEGQLKVNSEVKQKHFTFS